MMNDRYTEYRRLQTLLRKFFAATTPEEQGQALMAIGSATGDDDQERLSTIYAELLTRIPVKASQEPNVVRFGT